MLFRICGHTAGSDIRTKISVHAWFLVPMFLNIRGSVQKVNSVYINFKLAVANQTS